MQFKFNEIEPRSILKYNDFLMNIVGASIGRTAIYRLEEKNSNINQAVCLIRLGHNYINYEFLLYFFNSVICTKLMFDNQVDMARPNLSMTNIASFPIPIPPLEEQKQIVEKVEKLMATCDALELEVQNSKKETEKLMQSVLKEAFEK